MSTNNPAGESLGDPVGSASSRYSVETLALLHADALEEPERQQVQTAVAVDPAAQAILAGLDMVCAQLRKLDQALPPSEPMPELVARRLDRELAKLGGSAEEHRRRWAAAASVGSVAAAAAVLSLVTYAAWPRSEHGDASPVAQAPQSAQTAEPAQPSQTGAVQMIRDARFQIDKDDYQAMMRQGNNFSDLGPLADANTRSGCLVANGFSGNEKPVAAGRIARDGKEGIFMMILTPNGAGHQPAMSVLVVGTECKAGVPDTLSLQVFGKN